MKRGQLPPHNTYSILVKLPTLPKKCHGFYKGKGQLEKRSSTLTCLSLASFQLEWQEEFTIFQAGTDKYVVQACRGRNKVFGVQYQVWI